MVNQSVKARCNMFGVLKNIEYLVVNDKECANLVAGKKIAIQFNVKGGPSANLSFDNGKAEMKHGKHKSNISLFFKSPEHFNKMVDGEANPIPVKGFTKIGFLTGPFTQLADKLGFYLKPTKELLANKDYFKANTEMTAYAAFHALCEIANYDPAGMSQAKQLHDGDLLVAVTNGPSITISVKSGKLTAKKSSCSNPRAILSFSSLEVAHKILNNELDTFTAMGLGDMSMRGFIPMVEHIDPILGMVANYLA
ncbi:MAG: hypothetical protein JXR63_11060 [Spirochaetales bacterium]|nr:hypothetical protein [Spirochaetales bacterium]